MFSLIIFVMSLALIVVVNYNYYPWLFMPYFALPLFFSLTNLTIKVRSLNKITLFIGTISTYFFLSHPIVLKIREVLGFGNDAFVLQIILYVISSIIISFIYRYFHTILIKTYN